MQPTRSLTGQPQADSLHHLQLATGTSPSLCVRVCAWDGQEAERLLQGCEASVEALGLFSPNEEVDDVSTSDLKYMLVPVLRADMASLGPSGSGRDKQRAVQEALAHYERCGHILILAETWIWHHAWVIQKPRCVFVKPAEALALT